jgi:hypothetical protein
MQECFCSTVGSSRAPLNAFVPRTGLRRGTNRPTHARTGSENETNRLSGYHPAHKQSQIRWNDDYDISVFDDGESYIEAILKQFDRLQINIIAAKSDRAIN